MKKNFQGMPYAHRLLIDHMIAIADPFSGYVQGITYQDLINILKVDGCPGRKINVICSKQTIRSYLRTIETFCPDNFQVVSKGQQLIIKFPALPEIYTSHFEHTDQYTDQSMVSYTATSLINIDDNAINDGETNTDQYTQVYTEQYTAEPPVKNNYYLNKNKTNNNKLDSSKSLISDSFFPSAETLIRAREKGFENADDLAEIQAFIDHNKAIGSQWADFNPIYLRWLENGKERKARRTDAEKSGRVNNGTSCKTNKKSPKQRVIDAHSNEFDYCERTSRFYPKGTTAFSEQPAPKQVKYIDIDSLGPID